MRQVPEMTDAKMPHRPMAVAATCGIASGIALGAMVGPLGVVLGVGIGVGIGLVAGHVLAREEKARSRRTRELDAIIGVKSSPFSLSRGVWAAGCPTPPPPTVG